MESRGASSPGILTLTTGLSKPFMRLDKYPTLLKELERHMEVRKQLFILSVIYNRIKVTSMLKCLCCFHFALRRVIQIGLKFKSAWPHSKIFLWVVVFLFLFTYILLLVISVMDYTCTYRVCYKNSSYLLSHTGVPCHTASWLGCGFLWGFHVYRPSVRRCGNGRSWSCKFSQNPFVCGRVKTSRLLALWSTWAKQWYRTKAVRWDVTSVNISLCLCSRHSVSIHYCIQQLGLSF